MKKHSIEKVDELENARDTEVGTNCIDGKHPENQVLYPF
jgi:hypothetical protein